MYSSAILQAVYLNRIGRTEFKSCRASGFLEKSQAAVSRNCRALADLVAEKLMWFAEHSFDSTWEYVGTMEIDGREFHHYHRKAQKEGAKDNHLWLTTEELEE